MISSTIFATATKSNTIYPDNSFKGRATVSNLNGNLIIFRARKEDEGLYKCEYSQNVNMHQYQLVLHGNYAIFDIHVYVI